MGGKTTNERRKVGVEVHEKKETICFDAFFGKFNSYAKWEGLDAMPMGNYIIYGPMGCGKYTMAMNLIRPHSECSLRMCKTLNVTFNKKSYYIQMSDVHFEVDFNMMGSSAKLFWVHLYQIICDIVVLRKNRRAYILCKNFVSITNDLLDIFQTYVSPNNCMNNNCDLSFIILTDCVSFIPNNIISMFTLMRVPIHVRENGIEMCGVSEAEENMKNVVVMGVDNLVTAKKAGKFEPYRYKRVILSNVEDMIYNYCPQNSLGMRNALYDVYIYNWNIYELIWQILSRLVTKYDEELRGSSFSTHEQFKSLIVAQCFYLTDSLELYNVNYRPILHIEKMMIQFVTLIRQLNDLKESC